MDHTVYFRDMVLPITSDLRLSNSYFAVSNNLGDPGWFYEQGLLANKDDPVMTGKQIIDLKFSNTVLNKVMGGQSFQIKVLT